MDKKLSSDLRFYNHPPTNSQIFLVVYLLKLSSECLVSYDPHFPGNDGTNKEKDGGAVVLPQRIGNAVSESSEHLWSLESSEHSSLAAFRAAVVSA